MMLVTKLQPQLEPTTVGAKSANLGKAMEKGFSVPPGFVVTRSALDLFLQDAGLKTPVQTVLSDENASRAEAYDDLCHKIRIAPVPDPLAKAVVKMAEPLLAEAPGGVAVRSSGAHEDSATASFAGIYESYLGIQSMEDLWVSIKQCWCSAWSPQATAYANRMGIGLEYDSMAVLIQQLVIADSSGVLFTANPQTGNPWHFILESTFGLAQELVGSVGNVPADRFVLAWDSGDITEKHTAKKPTACMLGESGVQTVSAPLDRSESPSLSDELATSIAKQGLALDRIFGCRVDIEWAMADEEIQIIQVRPITALPPFFPHHLSPYLSEQTWEPRWPYWYFPNNELKGKVVPLLYQDVSWAEMFVRYQVGPIDLYNGRFAGLERDFHGHRYQVVVPRSPQAKPSLAELEAYLREYEPTLRQQWLEAKHHKFPAISAKAVELRQQANSLQELIEALLWVLDAKYDMGCQTIGPPQCLFGICITLFEDFIERNLPDLEPYYPHTQVQEAEALAATIEAGAIQQAFETMDLQSLFQYLVEHNESSPFALAYNVYCERLGLIPLNRNAEIYPGEEAIHYAVLQVVRDAFYGKQIGLVTSKEQITHQRQACEAKLRQALAKKDPALLSRFEQLSDWLYFWAPALNDRGWASVPFYLMRGLWMILCRKLQEAGLLDVQTDIGYFKTEDLAYIAQTGNLDEGRRILQRRQLEYERYDRLQPPLYLGKAPNNLAASKPEEKTSPVAEDGPKTVIHGRGHSPGQAQGVAHKIETLSESDTATDQHILILTKTAKPTSQYSALLLTLILRVQGIIVVQAGQTYTHHIAQIARECGVPVLEISPSDIGYIPDNIELVVDGSEGTVTIIK
ncbi:hypothetical protein KFU94_41185 [Chloroflexi bacterium TSY]|nr:hypothetical protein [Chloroflexi bacterium TSY]